MDSDDRFSLRLCICHWSHLSFLTFWGHTGRKPHSHTCHGSRSAAPPIVFAATFIIYNRTMEPLSLCLCAGLVPSAQDTIVAWYMHSVMYFTHMMLPSSSGAMADDSDTSPGSPGSSASILHAHHGLTPARAGLSRDMGGSSVLWT